MVYLWWKNQSYITMRWNDVIALVFQPRIYNRNHCTSKYYSIVYFTKNIPYSITKNDDKPGTAYLVQNVQKWIIEPQIGIDIDYFSKNEQYPIIEPWTSPPLVFNEYMCNFASLKMTKDRIVLAIFSEISTYK